MGKSIFWGKKMERGVREASSRQGGNKFLPLHKWQEGDTDIRLFPAAKGEDPDDWFVYVGNHYGLAKFPVVCPNVTDWQEEDCPICQMVAEMRESGMNDDASKYAVRRQFIARAIIRGEEDKGVQQIRMPSSLFKMISQFLRDIETFGNPLDMSPHGKDIRINKTGQNIQTTYTAQVLPKELALASKEQAMEWYNALTPILSLVEIPSTDQINQILLTKFGYAPGMEGMGASAPVADSSAGWGLDPSDTDVPFGGPEEVEDEDEDTDDEDDDTPDDDDASWANDKDDDDEEDDEEVSVSAAVKKSRATKVTITDDMEGDLKKAGVPVSRRTKSRVKA
jgi:hypothetical protein